MRALETLAEIFHQTATAGVMTPPPRVEKYIKNEVSVPFQSIPPPRVKMFQNTTAVPFQNIPLPRVPIINHVVSTPKRVTEKTDAQIVNDMNKLLTKTVEQKMNHVFTIDSNTNVNCNNIKQTAHTFYPEISNHMLCETTGKIMTYRGLLKTKYKDVWTNLCGNKFGR
jgi:hypothetical protein